MMKIYNELEKSFLVIYPESDKATYASILNFSKDLDKPFQRWFRYKEGFSLELVYKFIEENNLRSGTILDPFCGSGTTLLAANNKNINSIGFEVNPFTYFLSHLKLHKYTANEIQEFENNIERVLKIKSNKYCKLPEKDMMKNVFSENIKRQFMAVKYNIINLNLSKNVKNLFLLGWLSLIEPFSNYKKSGNGLKKRKAKIETLFQNNFSDELFTIYTKILEDIKTQHINTEIKIINDSCLKLDQYIEDESIDGVIFSPPYANCFDYTEIYKLELWFGDFVSTQDDIKRLRKLSLRSHLNADLNTTDLINLPYLDTIVSKLNEKKLWNKKIPTMLQLYFNDMFTLLNKLHKVMKKNAFCNIVVSNSAYGGIIIPTDLLLATYAKSIGFNVKKIEVDRYIVTSSQQHKSLLDYQKYLRESIICLKKS